MKIRLTTPSLQDDQAVVDKLKDLGFRAGVVEDGDPQEGCLEILNTPDDPTGPTISINTMEELVDFIKRQNNHAALWCAADGTVWMEVHNYEESA